MTLPLESGLFSFQFFIDFGRKVANRSSLLQGYVEIERSLLSENYMTLPLESGLFSFQFFIDFGRKVANRSSLLQGYVEIERSLLSEN